MKQRASEAGAALRDKPLEFCAVLKDAPSDQLNSLIAKLHALEMLRSMNTDWATNIYALNQTLKTYSPKSNQMKTVLNELNSSIKDALQEAVIASEYPVSFVSDFKKVPKELISEMTELLLSIRTEPDEGMKDVEKIIIHHILNKNFQLNNYLRTINKHTAKFIKYIDRIEAI